MQPTHEHELVIESIGGLSYSAGECYDDVSERCICWICGKTLEQLMIEGDVKYTENRDEYDDIPF